MVPSVTMKLGTRRIVVPSPLTTPTSTPMSSISAMAGSTRPSSSPM